MVKDHQQLAQKLQQVAGMHGSQKPSADDRSGTNTSVNANNDAGENAHAGHGALAQLASIEKEIAQQCTAAAKEELGQKSGAEFDECYLTGQIGGHMHMLAALEVIGQQSQGELRQVAEDAKPKVQEHLEKAKQLVEQMKSSQKADSGQANRQSRSQR